MNHKHLLLRRRMLAALPLLLTGCAPMAPSRQVAAQPRVQPQSVSLPLNEPVHFDDLALLNRISWGAQLPSVHEIVRLGPQRFLQDQLHPPVQPILPAEVQTQIEAMTLSQEPVDRLQFDLERRRKDADALKDDEDKKAGQRAYQAELNRLGREAATRSLLLALYSPNQLQEQLTWFWMNHFNLFLYKSSLRCLVGDFEHRAVRPHALGRFRDLLAATVFHPAMLRYLDNEQNAAGRINENYARELMELHTLGVGGGYSQNDVQELARILTGVGVNLNDPALVPPPRIRRELQGQYRRDGLFEFNPNRHDYGDKIFLGQKVRGRGLAEVDEVIDRLAKHPSTAHFICAKLAVFFVSDSPPSGLVDNLAREFTASDGNIASLLDTLFQSPEFAQSLPSPGAYRGKFKDPVQYVVSAVRLAYGDKVILNAGPLLNWLNRMGEPLYGHQTPDGYPLDSAAWSSPGQLNTRFEVARGIGSGNAGLFKTEEAERPAFPQLSNALYFESMQPRLGTATRAALERATSPQEWNTFLLSSPEFMLR